MQHDYILYIETATEICSVCVALGDTLVASVESEKPYVHTSELNLYIEKVIKKADISIKQLSCIGVSIGPGSYTGLRVGLATTKAIAYGLNIPILGISSLEALAYGIQDNLPPQLSGVALMPMIDARRMEVYSAIFSAEFKVLQEVDNIIIEKNTPDTLVNKYGTIYYGGNGGEKITPFRNDEKFCHVPLLSKAEYLIKKGYQLYQSKNFSDIFHLVPYYLKSPNITKSNKNLFE